MSNYEDIHFLHHALRIAERGLGRTFPNPSVGCVLVGDGRLLAATRTADGGRPHAETQALAIAGEAARGATAYVTLEPCAHHGVTPPCAQALIDAGIARVVVAAVDPDPRVLGRGITMLQAAGITVTQHILPEAATLNRGFFRRVQHGMPYVAMKIATSADQAMVRSDGGGRWITGIEARMHGQRLRGQHDAIVTGIGTVLADDPQLNVRPPNLPHPRLVRVVCDRHLRLPLTSTLVKTVSRQPTWVVTSAEGVEQAASHATDLREAGVKFLVVEDSSLAPANILKTLAAEGITRAFMEAGPVLSNAFLAAGLVNTLHWYRAPIVLGNAGKPAIAVLDSTLVAAGRQALAETRPLGADTYERYELS